MWLVGSIACGLMYSMALANLGRLELRHAACASPFEPAMLGLPLMRQKKTEGVGQYCRLGFD